METIVYDRVSPDVFIEGTPKKHHIHIGNKTDVLGSINDLSCNKPQAKVQKIKTIININCETQQSLPFFNSI